MLMSFTFLCKHSSILGPEYSQKHTILQYSDVTVLLKMSDQVLKKLKLKIIGNNEFDTLQKSKIVFILEAVR